MATDMQVMAVTCPPNVQSGGQVQIIGPAGGLFAVTVPPGIAAGQQFQVLLPRAHPAQIPPAPAAHLARPSAGGVPAARNCAWCTTRPAAQGHPFCGRHCAAQAQAGADGGATAPPSASASASVPAASASASASAAAAAAAGPAAAPPPPPPLAPKAASASPSSNAAAVAAGGGGGAAAPQHGFVYRVALPINIQEPHGGMTLGTDCRVMAVAPGSLGAQAGVQVGSTLRSVNGVAMRTVEQCWSKFAEVVVQGESQGSATPVQLELSLPAPQLPPPAAARRSTAPLGPPPSGVGQRPPGEACPPGCCPFCHRVHGRHSPVNPGHAYCSRTCSATARSLGWGHGGQAPQGAAGVPAHTVVLCPQCNARPVSGTYRHCSKACAVAAKPPAGPNDCRFCYCNGRTRPKHPGSDYCGNSCKSSAESAGWVAGLSPAELAKGGPPAQGEARVTGYHGTQTKHLPSVSGWSSVCDIA